MNQLDLKQDRTMVDSGGAKSGNGSLAMIGAMRDETRQQTCAIAEVAAKKRREFFGRRLQTPHLYHASPVFGRGGAKDLVEVREKIWAKNC